MEIGSFPCQTDPVVSMPRQVTALDFEEDRMALEAYIREKTQWRDDDEVSPEECAHYASEYMTLNPISLEPIMNGREFIVYQRWDGEFIAYKMLPFLPLIWQKGKFLEGMRQSIEAWADYWFVGTIFRFLHWRFWFEYVGLAESRRHFPSAIAPSEE